MPSMGPSFFFLGLVMASVTANETSTTMTGSSPSSREFTTPVYLNNDAPFSATPSLNTKDNTNTTSNITNITSISTTTSSMVISNINGTIIPLTTKDKGNASSQSSTAKITSTTLKSTRTSKRPTSTTKKQGPGAGSTAGTSDSTGIIILVVIILVALAFGIACYIARKRGRRYSVDFTSRPDEANIPLSTVEPELPVDAGPQNGMKTFEPEEVATKEPQEPEEKPAVQEEQKAEAEKLLVEASAESAAPVPPPDSSEDQPKEDVVEQSPPAPEPSVEEKTDDEGVVSNKTSVESLKETNENNSNNAHFSQWRDLNSNLFWDVPLDWPV
uniref:uncharacterized protein si:dkey-27h10.2 n=1 Tax=Scatophagus argus TaxID=75038 RepID=UPI001ED80F0B|nr:uncharacterized protein si:dkey-27h10.2 [Scatophagus argus]